jgi:putative heme-binding domain-containing protein
VGAGQLLDAWAADFADGKVAPELQLDVLEALQATPDGKRREALDRWQSKLSATDPLARFRIALHGGDAQRGRELFVGHAAAQCVRCHRVHGHGGDAGPDLTEVVKRHPERTREFVLESMILPSAQVAPGYGSVTLTLTSGKVIAGTMTAESADDVTLRTPDGNTVRVAAKDIEERTLPTSAMPPMDRVLSLRELRDLVEYLATLK